MVYDKEDILDLTEFNSTSPFSPVKKSSSLSSTGNITGRSKTIAYQMLRKADKNGATSSKM